MQPRKLHSEETLSNCVSDFCDFVCSLFPKAFLFDYYFIEQWVIYKFSLMYLMHKPLITTAPINPNRPTGMGGG